MAEPDGALAMADVAEPDGALAIWDNSNIAESYGGITTPLTFTFARNAYEGVFGLLCSIFRIPPKRIEENRDALANMLGFCIFHLPKESLGWTNIGD